MRKRWGVFLLVSSPAWASNYGDLGTLVFGIFLVGLSVPAFFTAALCCACLGKGRAGCSTFLFCWIAGTLLAFAGFWIFQPLAQVAVSSPPVGILYSSLVTLGLFLMTPKPESSEPTEPPTNLF